MVDSKLRSDDARPWKRARHPAASLGVSSLSAAPKTSIPRIWLSLLLWHPGYRRTRGIPATPIMQASTSRDPKELVQPAVQANKEHQYALKVYTERLEAELEHLNKLLVGRTGCITLRR